MLTRLPTLFIGYGISRSLQGMRKMGGQPFHNTVLWVFAVAPLGVLAAAGLLGGVLGEWSRAALLAYSSVLLGLMTGVGSASGTLPVLAASLLGLGGLFVGFAALSLGGAYGHTLLAGAYVALTAVAWLRPNIGLPWPFALVAALACVIAIVQERF
jgi:hypothetical protein